jgi:reverse gyrase
MKIEDIKNENIIIKIKKLLKKKEIKASDIDIDYQNNSSYIHFGVNLFNKDEINILYTNNNFVNDEIDDMDDNKFVEIFGMDPDAIINGPIDFKEIEDVYYYLGGPQNHEIYNKDDKVFFCFDEYIKSYILNK